MNYEVSFGIKYSVRDLNMTSISVHETKPAIGLYMRKIQQMTSSIPCVTINLNKL